MSPHRSTNCILSHVSVLVVWFAFQLSLWNLTWTRQFELACALMRETWWIHILNAVWSLCLSVCLSMFSCLCLMTMRFVTRGCDHNVWYDLEVLIALQCHNWHYLQWAFCSWSYDLSCVADCATDIICCLCSWLRNCFFHHPEWPLTLMLQLSVSAWHCVTPNLNVVTLCNVLIRDFVMGMTNSVENILNFNSDPKCPMSITFQLYNLVLILCTVSRVNLRV